MLTSQGLARKFRLNYLAILWLSACLPHTGEVKSEDEGYWLDVSKLGHASVRYRASDGSEKILPLNIARISLQGKSVAVAALEDTPQLLQAGSDSQQEFPELKSPALAVEKFYILSEVAFYMQSNDNKKYFCQLKDVPLGSKYNFSLTSDVCEENGREPERVYFSHEYGDAKGWLSKKIMQIDCEATYGDKQQLLSLAVQNGTIIDDKGSYAFAKQAGAEFKLKCRNNFSHKPLFGQEELKQGESNSVKIKNFDQLACFRFSDGWLHTTWQNVIGKVADACKKEEELLRFNFSDKDPTRDGGLVPSYFRPDTILVKDVKDDTPLKDIYVLSRCDNCMPDWAKHVHCAVACQSTTFAYTDKIVAPGTVIYAGAREHYSQRLFCPGHTQTLTSLSTDAALTCSLTRKEGETTELQSFALTDEIVRSGKVCVDFTPEKKLTISAVATCDSKLRFFFKAVNRHQ